MDESDFKDDEKVKFYTGFASADILLATFDLISPGISQCKNLALSKFQKFVCTLLRMRLNLQIQDLAYRYCVSAAVISKAFGEIIDLLFVNLKPAIHWPDYLITSMPRKVWYKNCEHY